ncbi:MAG: sulfatase-like hydrolase/transferase [bacterium]|nr:sulfatase-like hydrolase/transferase [bacterium]
MAQFSRKKGQPKTWEPPNILLITADDLGAWACGTYGNKEIRTPNIDLLARLGTRFRNNYVVTPMDSASRATLYTGLLPSQHGIEDYLTDSPVESPPQGQSAPPESFANETMVSDLLAGAGYNCGYVGKWHMGSDARPGHGYEFTYTLPAGDAAYQDPLMSRNGEEVRESGYVSTLMTKAACEFLEGQSADKRFFLSVNYLNPSRPYEGHPRKFYDQYSGVNFETLGFRTAARNGLRDKQMLEDTVGNLRRYAASVSAMDAEIPVLLEKLREKQLRRNTLLVFTSDNGNLLGRHGLWGAGLASDPANMYDEVMKVPMIWVWPGKVPVEATRPELVSFYDVMPSLLQAAKVTPPDADYFCGRSYLSIAMGGQWKGEEDWPVYLYGEYRDSLMARDRRYKMIVRNQGEGPNELYDLNEDPGELRNRYDNPQYVQVRNRLTEHLDAWSQQYGHPPQRRSLQRR